MLTIWSSADYHVILFIYLSIFLTPEESLISTQFNLSILELFILFFLKYLFKLQQILKHLILSFYQLHPSTILTHEKNMSFVTQPWFIFYLISLNLFNFT